MNLSRISLKFLIILLAVGCARMEDKAGEAPSPTVVAATEEANRPPLSVAPANVAPASAAAPMDALQELRWQAGQAERAARAERATGAGTPEKAVFEEGEAAPRPAPEPEPEAPEAKPELKTKSKPKKPRAPLAGRNQPAADIGGDFDATILPKSRLVEDSEEEESALEAPAKVAEKRVDLPLGAGDEVDALMATLDDGKRDASKNEEGRMGGREDDGRLRRLLGPRGRDGAQNGVLDATLASEKDIGNARLDTGLQDDGWIADTPSKPAAFLPSMFYFENTYLGRSAQFIERLRRLDAAWPGEGPYRLATLPPQGVDPPDDKGLSLSVALDRTSIDQPGKVYLQVTLQGSSRFGWRRPPLDVAVVIDAGAAGRRPEQVVAALQRLLATLGPQDRLGVVLAGDPPVVLAEVGELRETRRVLGRLAGRTQAGPLSLHRAMQTAGLHLQAASQGQARVPGAQTVLVIVDGGEGAEIAAVAAHALTVQGATTSVIELGGQWAWWPVANAGHGNLHRVEGGDVAAAVDAELARISQVIARLLRVNIRLAPNVHAVRVLGSRVLEQEEVRQVKAREEATDRQLSATLGVKADRGDDDDGIQTVIPFFYGGDAHVIAVELWVEKPGPVAEISLKYKDMVALENATAQAGARIGGVAKPTTQAELAVRRNVRGFLVAEALDEAGRLVASSRYREAEALLARTEAGAGSDAPLLAGFRQALQQPPVNPQVLSEALDFAGQRRISHVALR